MEKVILTIVCIAFIGVSYSKEGVAFTDADFVVEKGVLMKDKGKAADVAIPGGVTRIYHGAFLRCNKLASDVIPNTVTSIGQKAFYNLKSLHTVAIPKSVQKIEQGAFGSCKKMQKIIVDPDTRLTIESNVFYEVDIYKIEVCFPDGTESDFGNHFEIKSTLFGQGFTDSKEITKWSFATTQKTGQDLQSRKSSEEFKTK